MRAKGETEERQKESEGREEGRKKFSPLPKSFLLNSSNMANKYSIIWHFFSRNDTNTVRVETLFFAHLVLRMRRSLTIPCKTAGNMENPDRSRTNQNARSIFAI